MSLGRNAIYNFIGQAAPIAVVLVTVPIYLRLIGVERYGVLAIAWLLLGYFGLFDLGLTRATAYRIALRRDHDAALRATTFWTAIAVSLCLSLAGAVLLYFGGSWYFSQHLNMSAALRGETLAALPVLAVALPGAIMSGVLNGALQGREQFFEVNLIGVGSSAMTQIGPVLVAWQIGPRLDLLIIASVAVQFVALGILWQRCRRHIFGGYPIAATKVEAVELMRFGGWITVSAVLAPIIVLIDRFVIGSLLNATAVTTYSLPAQMAQRASIIPYALATALFPRLSADSDRARATELAQMSTRTAMAVMTPIVLIGICAMGPFLAIWLNNALPPVAVTIGQVALLGWWVNGIAINPFGLLQASGKPRIPALLHVVELPLYCGLLWALTVHWGPVGAAIAFSIRCGVDCLALCAFAYRWSTDLIIYAFPAALLTIAVPMIGAFALDPMSLAEATLLLMLALGWSMLVLPTHLRQGLLRFLSRKPWIRHA